MGLRLVDGARYLSVPGHRTNFARQFASLDNTGPTVFTSGAGGGYLIIFHSPTISLFFLPVSERRISTDFL